ncbi:cache domain-containing protein [Neptunomonas qingdaonensis]|uniref:PAS domain S-box-containing protein n=1 Tax=Neptunomonas qingdaonensis TaxID=1045558 RepID=A0A1I2P244_9GAMM|nr:cache domain-containing protein [Neptunomonas qingdaonensis]SFG07521.1 PAS domain S-box-containing protein [Neptunomonas qingdaonensis]
MNRSPRFISLRWKLWMPFLLAVLSIHVGLYSYVGRQIERQYELDQQVSFKSNLKALDGVLTTSYHKLLEVGQTILIMKQTASNLLYKDYIYSSISEKFPQLEAQGILDGAAVFDTQGQLVFSVGNIDIQSNSGVQPALKNERPIREMRCDNQCIRTIAIPLLNSGKVEGVLVLGRLMQDMVLDFKQLTAVDIGIARKNLENASDIDAWSLDFTQLTQRNKNMQILQTLSQQITNISNETLYRVDVFDRHYEIYFTVPASVAFTDTVWVLMIDGTIRYQAIRALKNQLAVGLIISSLFLLMIAFVCASKVARRLLNVTLFLKEQGFLKEQDLVEEQGLVIEKSSAKEQCAGRLIDARQDPLFFQDEISEISLSVRDVSDMVEHLSEGEQKSSQCIESMAKALRLEKERVAHLVGNTQNVIVTQSTDGTVLTINDVGKKLFGITKEAALPKFVDLFFTSELNQQALDGITRLYMGLDNLVYLDSQSLDLKGQLRDFSWIHSYISACSEHRAIILSVGIDMTEKREAERKSGLPG